MWIKGLVRRHMGLLIPVAALAAGWPAPTHAALVTIDFGTGGDTSAGSLYTEDEINVAGSNVVLTNRFGNEPGIEDRSTILGTTGSTTLTITSISGLPFSLVSFDNLCLAPGCPNTINVQGTLSGGGSPGTTVQSFDNWSMASGFAGFTNLSSLTINWGGSNINHLDNIVLDVVPLPAALPLLVTALAGLGLAWRRAQRVGA